MSKQSPSITLDEFLELLTSDIDVTNGDYELDPNDLLYLFEYFNMNPISFFIKQAFWFAMNDQYEFALKKIKYFKRFDSEDFQILAASAEVVIKCIREND